MGQKLRRQQGIETAYFVPVTLWSANPDLMAWTIRANCEHVMLEHYRAKVQGWRLDHFPADVPLDDRGNRLNYAVIRVICKGARIVEEKIKTPLLGIDGRPIGGV
jgi:hypothetical protein